MEQNLKKQLYDFCKNFADNRISRIRLNIADFKESLDSETKSSAGDKHETGRAMLQLELEKSGVQLAEAEKMAKVLDMVNIKTKTNFVGLGNLVKTNKANYFLGISAGEYKVDGISVYCISSETPMGKLLFGKEKGAIITFNTNEITINEIL
ncbi:3-oxoacyl-ACP synthase [Cellulophaga baltica]|uniref:3-oxoacyl-ACP synthase n=1 Tax=Cellulophaga baltica TaxID=76594 RepID=UPI0015F6F3DB|nr:3-oxoacyl-ACP synthase [Cellulophaga baltica]MBA6313972.1 3-oxoacyl-ACP synthase [Cellulophaga baltica]